MHDIEAKHGYVVSVDEAVPATGRGAGSVTTMSRAAVLTGERQLEIRELPLPKVKDDDGLLRIEATGVCGSDVGAFYGRTLEMQVPCVLGHELVGRIEQLGERAAEHWGVAVGDRVVVEEYMPCGTCHACLGGYYQMCPSPRYGGTSVDTAPALWGGYSDFMYLHPQSLVHRVDDEADPKLVQLYIPISNGIHWTSGIGGAAVGGVVVVIGPGPHGLGCVVGAKEAGAGLVVLVGQPRDVTRLEVGRALGADLVLSGDSAEVGVAVRTATGALGADTVVNTVGSDGLRTALAMAGDRATIVQAGFGDGSVPEELPAQLILKMLTLHGVRGRPSRVVASALRLIESGRYPLERMCSAVFDVDETEQALTAVRADPGIVRAVVTGRSEPREP